MTGTDAAERLRREDTFDGETFTGVDLQSFSLAGKEFYRCTFEHCHLQESVWKNASLEACTFRGVDLTRARLLHTGLRGVRFEGSKLMGIDWSSVSPNPELHFTECNLRYASFSQVNLRQCVFEKCSVREANFLDAELTDADFSGSDLAGSNVRGCVLTRTDFSTTTGLFLEPGRNKVKGTHVSVETAVLLAQSLGLAVVGYDDAPKRPKR
jgi:uncharacterized protein YjbI with pentapeptide repeats